MIRLLSGLGLFLFFLAGGGWAATTAPEEAFRRGYEIEQAGGDPAAALALYETAAAGADRELALRARFRIGFCRRLLGQDEEARAGWARLQVEPGLPADLSTALTALLAGLSRDRERRLCRGRVVDGEGRGLAGVPVWLGDWSIDPPVVSGTGGWFEASRRYSGVDPDGTPYLLAHARTDSGGWAGVARVEGSAAQGEAEEVTIRLAPVRRLTGRVETAAGRPLAGARIIRETFLDRAIPVWVPLDLLSPDPVTDEAGEYAVEEVAGTALKIRAEHPALPRAVFGEIEPTGESQRLSVLRPRGESPRRIEVTRWVRGEGWATGGEVGALKGRWVVLHFGSAYAAAELRRRSGAERTILGAVQERFGVRGVEVIWILPAEEDRAEVWGLIPERVEYRVGVDREGLTAGSFPEAAARGNAILDPAGRVRVEGCRDSELWWWLTRLVGE